MKIINCIRLKAVDNAGNVTELMVYAVRKGSFAIKEIELKNNGEDIQTVDGEKKISMKSGQNSKLSAFAVLDDGKEFELSDDMIDWSVLYEKNHIALDEGDITALSKGETAVKVKMNTANIQTAEDKNIEDGFSDYAVIEITGNSKEDLIEKIKEAQELLDNTPNASDSKKMLCRRLLIKHRSLLMTVTQQRTIIHKVLRH